MNAMWIFHSYSVPCARPAWSVSGKSPDFRVVPQVQILPKVEKCVCLLCHHCFIGSWSPAWSFNADGQRSKPGQLEALAASQALLLSKDVPQEAPATSADFTRCWRRSCPSVDHKYRYLQLCGPQVLGAVFKTDISSELLKVSATHQD